MRASDSAREDFLWEARLVNGVALIFDDARPGAFDTAKVAGEFGEIWCTGIGAHGFAGSVQIKATHLRGRKFLH
jgi:hypothetical protein